MYADLPPPKSVSPPATVKQEIPAANVAAATAAANPVKRELGEDQITIPPHKMHGIALPEWVRPPLCQLVLEERKDDAVLSRIPLHELPVYVIGREVNTVDIPLLHPTISRKHALIVHGVPPNTPVALQAIGATLIDLKSSSGTFFRGGLAGRKRQLVPGATVVLRDEMVFQFGNSSRSYRVCGASEPIAGIGKSVSHPANSVDMVKLALAQEEGDVELAFPKELHPAVKAKLAAAEPRAVGPDPFQTSSILNEVSDLVPQAVSLNEHFLKQSVLGKRAHETAFSGQASLHALQEQRMRQRNKLLQQTQGHVIEGSDRMGVQSVVVEPSAGPGARVAVAVQRQGEGKRLAIMKQHLTELEQKDQAEDAGEDPPIKSEQP